MWIPKKELLQGCGYPFILNLAFDKYIELCSNSDDDYEGYTEKHHIIPRSFFKDDVSNRTKNAKKNLVVLSAKRHFEAHEILINCTTGIFREKALTALFFMQQQYKSEKFNKEDYEFVRSRIRFDHFKGRKHTKETKEHLSNVMSGMKNHSFGSKWINNGYEDIRIGPDEELPEGYIYGRIENSVSKTVWINNGFKEHRVKDDKIPEGFILGRIKKK